jgi:hypothetical protein
MNELIQRLKGFNAKERYFLVRQVLGVDKFSIGQDFRNSLRKLGINIPDGVEPFAAMDYHLDWLYAALHPTPDGRPQRITDENIQANQEDVDFLIAYEAEGIAHIVLLEAKAFTGWTNAQLDSKKARLERMFTPEILVQGVQPHFVLISPKESDGLKTEGYPDWMCPGGKFLWLSLNLECGVQKVTRCGSDGKAKQGGDYWKIEPRSKGTSNADRS